MAVQGDLRLAASEAHALRVVRGYKEHGVEYNRGIGTEVHPRQRLLVGVAHEFVELGVFLLGNVLLVLHPDGLHGVLPLAVHGDGEGDEVAVLAHNVAQVAAAGKLGGVFLQVDEDACAARGVFLSIGDGVAVLPIARPLDGLGLRLPGAGGELHLVCRHEDAVEAHAELADEVLCAALLLLGHLQEFLGAGVGNGAQVLHHFLLGHADAGVGDGQGLGLLIGGEGDGGLQLRVGNGRAGELLEAQFLQGIRGVGDELADKDFAVAVEGMDDDVQQLPDLCLECMRLFCHNVIQFRYGAYYRPQRHGVKGESAAYLPGCLFYT